MRRDLPTTPFDVEATEALDLTEEFWGPSRGWAARDTHAGKAGELAAPHDPWRDDTTGALRAIRDGVRAFRPQRVSLRDATGQVARTRQHGVVGNRAAPAPEPVATRERSLGELAAGWVDEDWTEGWDDLEPTAAVPVRHRPDRDPSPRRVPDELVPLSPVQPLAERLGLGAVDPLLARVGIMVLAAALLVPLALAMRASDAPEVLTAAVVAGATTDETNAGIVSSTGGSTASPTLTADAPAPGERSAPPMAPAAAPASDASGSSATVGRHDGTVAASAVASMAAPTSDDGSSPVGDVIQSELSAPVQAATASAVAERYEPACPTTYAAAPGDSWYRIADAADVTTAALLAENRARLDTVILVGDDICLPAGATMPAPPSTTAPAPATTQPPATTLAPATTQPPATARATPDQVQQLIRDIWPDDLEEQALRVAWRESNYRTELFNGFCCYGVFQIYWTVHRNWLDDYGVYSSSDLFDARKNITAAYALYQRSGGWGPWGG